MDLTNNAIIPLDHLIELETAAYDRPRIPRSIGDRVASTAQTTIVTGALVTGFVACCYGYAKAADWYEERKLQRQMKARKSEETPS